MAATKTGVVVHTIAAHPDLRPIELRGLSAEADRFPPSLLEPAKVGSVRFVGRSNWSTRAPAPN